MGMTDAFVVDKTSKVKEIIMSRFTEFIAPEQFETDTYTKDSMDSFSKDNTSFYNST